MSYRPDTVLPAIVRTLCVPLVALACTAGSSAYDGQSARDMNRVPAESVMERLATTPELDIQQAQIIGPLTLTLSQQLKKFTVERSTFDGPLIASGGGSSPEARLELRDNIFRENVDLSGTTYLGTLDISNSSFEQSLDISRSTFGNLVLRGTRFTHGANANGVSFDMMFFDDATDLEGLHLSNDTWVTYLTNLSSNILLYPSLYADAAAAVVSYPGKLPTDRNVRYLARVVRRNVESNAVKRGLDLIFLDYTVGYGFKRYRLLFWIVPLATLGLTLYQRKLSTASLLRERHEKYPIWEERLDREFIGQPAVDTSFIPKRHRDFAVLEYRGKHADLEFVIEPTRLVSKNAQSITAFRDAWSTAEAAARVNNRDLFESSSKAIAELLCQRLEFRFLTQSDYYDGSQAFKASTPSLKVNVPSHIAIIFVGQSTHSVDTVRSMVELMRLLGTESRYFGIALAFAAPDQLRRAVRESGPFRSDFVVIDRRTAWDILAKTSPVRRLAKEILAQVDLLAVSPFELAGPVSDRMFYGRLEEEKTLTRSVMESNFAIVANRKIGKTSLLERVTRTLSGDAQYYVASFDLQRSDGSYGDFFKLLAADGAFAPHIHTLRDISPTDFYRVVEGVHNASPDRRLVLIFDEVDDLLQYDNTRKTPLFRTARALSQKNVCRFIFVGSKTLAESVSDSNSPFFNFCAVMRLGCLDRTHAERLVREPLSEMGIGFDNESEVLERILAISAAHPNLLQYTCHQLLRRLNQENRRTIFVSDVDATVSTDDYCEYFTTVVWGQASDFERLIVYIMMISRRNEFTLEDVASELRKWNIPSTRLKKQIDILLLYSLLRRADNQLELTFKFLPEALRRTVGDLEELVRMSSEELTRGGTPSADGSTR
jgi:hypothetical protein